MYFYALLVFANKRGQIASAEKDGVWEYRSRRAGELSFGQAPSIMLKPDVERCFLLVTWAPLVRHLHKCHLYSSQCGRESGNGGPAARSGKMKSAVGSKLPSTTSVCSLPALFLSKHEWDMQTSASCRKSCFVIVLPAHSDRPGRHVVCAHCLTLAVKMFFSLTGNDLLSILNQWYFTETKISVVMIS